MKTRSLGWWLSCAGLVAAVGAALLPAMAAAQSHASGGGGAMARPLVIGHRGTAGYLPEHTLEG